jgi:hypothetical protein
MVLYALVARVWPGLTAAALATVAIGSLGAGACWGAVAGRAGRQGGRRGPRAGLGLGGRRRPAMLLAAASWGFTKGEVERIFQFLVPLVLVPAVRPLLAWRARVPVVVGLLVGQTLLVQALFATRW